jgi:hypothetical protein
MTHLAELTILGFSYLYFIAFVIRTRAPGGPHRIICGILVVLLFEESES